MASTNQVIFSTDFSTDPDLDPRLLWSREPSIRARIMREGEGERGLHICMDEKTDFWQRTYYDPPMVKDDGHMLYMETSEVTMVTETSFTLQAVNQFDQAGLIVRLDKDHWIKTGLEYVDGSYRLSCVVTNSFSDWSTQDWPHSHLHIRIYRIKNDFVVEGSADGDTWSMMRVCRLHMSPDAVLKTGILACAPITSGGQATFHKLSMAKCQGYHHKA